MSLWQFAWHWGPQASGEVYNITNGEPRAFKDLIEETLRGLGYPITYRKVPAPLLSVIASSLEFLYKVLKPQRWTASDTIPIICSGIVRRWTSTRRSETWGITLKSVFRKGLNNMSKIIESIDYFQQATVPATQVCYLRELESKDDLSSRCFFLSNTGTRAISSMTQAIITILRPGFAMASIG